MTTETQQPIYTVGYDDRGNAIQVMDQGNGTWTHLTAEHELTEAQARVYWPELFADNPNPPEIDNDDREPEPDDHWLDCRQ